MKKMSAICLFIICSLFFTSCGNFSSADSYVGNVYSKPEVLSKNNKEKEKGTEEFTKTEKEFETSETTAAEIEPSEVMSETEPITESEILTEEKETITETEETKLAIDIGEEQNDDKYVVTENGKKLHREECRTVKSVKQYISYGDAVKLGYDPCKICNPVND